MDLDIEKTVYRIISGFYFINIEGIEYKIIVPTRDILYRSHLLYLSIIDDLKFDTSWISKKSINVLLQIHNLWNKSKEDELASLNKILEGAKIQLYLKYESPNLRKQNKELIKKTVNSINELYQQKNYFNSLSLEDYASSVKNQYIIINTVYKDNQLLFSNDLDNIDLKFLDNIVNEIHKNFLDSDDLKKIAHHPFWRLYWNASKDHIFDKSVIEWTEEQRLLVTFSKNYDAIVEHPEAPSQDIINDTDALDGWILYQNEKANKERKTRELEEKYNLNKNNKVGGFQEVFIPVQSKEEAIEVHSLNDVIAEQNRRQILQHVKPGETVDWAELPPVKRELKNKQAEIIKQRKG